MIKRDGANPSLWQKTSSPYQPTSVPDKENVYDVIIVGGGITGLTSGLLLQKAGLKCLVMEAAGLCFGTTGGTTAHINTVLDTPYTTISKNFGVENAKLVADAAKDALSLIKKNIVDHTIECEYEDAEAFLYAQGEKQTKELEEILQASVTSGINMDYSESIPIPIGFEKAARIEGQGKFHPVQYVYGLAKAFEENGGIVVQHCRAIGLEENEIAGVLTERGKFFARKVIYATHTPMGVNLVHLRCQPFRSYAMAVTLKDKKYPQGLCYDMYDPYHYYRTQVIENKSYLIVGGNDHKTGKEDNTENCFRKLEAHINKHFTTSSIKAKWSSQYFEPTDGLPYIGRLPGHSDLVYTAGGFGGNGITYSHVSALIFKSIFLKEENPYINLFDPNRIKPVAGFKNFIVQNIETIKNFIGKLSSTEEIDELSEMAPGEGRIVKYGEDKIALYKGEEGKIHAVHPQCTHLNCTVSWNATEKSWDCSCHGARYSVDGKVLNGPADRNLEKVLIGQLTN